MGHPQKFNDRVRFIKLDFRGEGENKSADGLMALITQLARKETVQLFRIVTQARFSRN